MIAWLSSSRPLAGGFALEMEYYTAGRDVVTHRTVEPYRIEYRKDVPYLIAYCHLAERERVFRVDRIRQIKPGHDIED